ncbi:hypothetical protein BJ875DRAFT_481503 [Amylocarpus encephaloides]|uniref:Uncharacterized protein n=1 Tax=Amylocarpus encephaloides TaxID=45428 RepID=A0A9P8C895_9HELO|nr:hypothetical protein BJ875DRAFT_481503 [Amylocarpus encephaloides]
MILITRAAKPTPAVGVAIVIIAVMLVVVVMFWIGMRCVGKCAQHIHSARLAARAAADDRTTTPASNTAPATAA